MSFTQKTTSRPDPQAIRRQRAQDQRANYTLTWSELRVREHCGRAYVVPFCLVTKADGTTYQVTYRPQGVPICSCQDSKRFRGTSTLCKHACLANEDKQRRAQAGAETAEEKRARVLAERSAWD